MAGGDLERQNDGGTLLPKKASHCTAFGTTPAGRYRATATSTRFDAIGMERRRRATPRTERRRGSVDATRKTYVRTSPPPFLLTWTFLSTSMRGSNGPTVLAAPSSPFRQAREAACRSGGWATTETTQISENQSAVKRGQAAPDATHTKGKATSALRVEAGV